MSNGKGDLQRPRQVTQEEFDEAWRRIFGPPPEPKPSREQKARRIGQIELPL